MTAVAYRSAVVLDPSPAELLARREAAGLPAGLVARLMGVTTGRLRDWERGITGIAPGNHTAWIDALGRAIAGEVVEPERRPRVCWDLWVPPPSYRRWSGTTDTTVLGGWSWPDAESPKPGSIGRASQTWHLAHGLDPDECAERGTCEHRGRR